MVGRQEDKLRRLYETYHDKLGVAKMMRQNLAADIVAGYGLANVTRQMIQIEDYERTTVKAAEQEYLAYRNTTVPDNKEFYRLERKWAAEQAAIALHYVHYSK